MKRRSPLETLKQVRERAHERQQSALAARVEAERAAVAAEALVRQRLAEVQRAHEAAREREASRLRTEGITAADGQRRMAWENALRQRERQLSLELARAEQARRAAERAHEEARSALVQSDAELKQVQNRLELASRAVRLELERAQQEALDESSSRRFRERGEA